METLDRRAARRLALARAGLLKPRLTGLPQRAQGRGKRALAGALAVIRRFGYLQLDSIPVTGARTHGIVLLSRLEGLDPELPEELLSPGVPLFEYWGHEACWLPLELYPYLAFRRQEFTTHPWWGDLVGQHPEIADSILERIRQEGPLRSVDLGEANRGGFWKLGVAKKVAASLWLRGDLAIRQRRGFQRTFDLAERVIPAEVRGRDAPYEDSLQHLLLLALDGHGWATTGTLAATWRLRNQRPAIDAALAALEEEGRIAPCTLQLGRGKSFAGWIRPRDLELAATVRAARPRRDQGVLLSPFDPVLWDRTRVKQLFGFEQAIEIYKPADQRVYGYYCLPLLAGDRLVGRFDLKADRKAGTVTVQNGHYEAEGKSKAVPARDRAAAHAALERFATSVGLELRGRAEAGIP